MKKKSLFITFEGGEGSGKTTQIKILCDFLTKRSLDLVLTREPGGPDLSEKIRNLLLEKSKDPMDFRTELLLYEAARAEHVEKVIKPALSEGRVVISDRFSDSSLVYQGLARGIPFSKVESLNDFATDGVYPNLTFYFDLDPQIGLGRVKKRGRAQDRLESEGLRFHKKVREGFLKISRKYKNRFIVIDAKKSIEEISEIIRKRVLNLLDV